MSILYAVAYQINASERVYGGVHEVNEMSTVRRGRPPNRERRHAIIIAAIDLFGRRGYIGTTMHEVADAVAISEALLYRYFPTKRALLYACIAWAHKRTAAAVERCIAVSSRPSTLRDYLTSIGAEYLAHLDDLKGWFLIRLLDLPISAAERACLHADPERAFRAFGEALAARGSFSDPYVAARGFIGALTYQMSLQEQFGFERGTPELQALFLAGIVDIYARAGIAGAA